MRKTPLSPDRERAQAPHRAHYAGAWAAAATLVIAVALASGTLP